jgi:hypothetical protein
VVKKNPFLSFPFISVVKGKGVLEVSANSLTKEKYLGELQSFFEQKTLDNNNTHEQYHHNSAHNNNRHGGHLSVS